MTVAMVLIILYTASELSTSFFYSLKIPILMLQSYYLHWQSVGNSLAQI